MKNVYLVSYPRSGQHYTQRLLERVTGSDDYCELYSCAVEGCPGKGLPLAQRSPCLSGRRFQKSHDFDLALPVGDDSLYVVLFRRPLLSITSYFELDTRDGKGVPLKGANGKKIWHPESEEMWEQYAIEKAAYWRDFVNKWCSLSRGNVHLMQYEEITRDLAAAENFFRFVFPMFDERRLVEVMQLQRENLENGVHPNRSLSEFRYPVSDKLLGRLRSVIGQQALAMSKYEDVA